MSKDQFPLHALYILDAKQDAAEAVLNADSALKRTSLRLHVHEGMVEVRASTYYALSLAQSALKRLGARDLQHLPQEDETTLEPVTNVLDTNALGDEDPDALTAVAE